MLIFHILSTDGSTELSERAKLYPLAPRIVVSYKVYVDTIGSNVVLPCRVKGHPRPKVTWRDNKGVLAKNDPRMKVRLVFAQFLVSYGENIMRKPVAP